MNDLKYAFLDFDESTYLKLNTDVSEAIQKGSFSSGLEHYFSHGIREDRHGVPPAVRNVIKTILENIPVETVPPEHLRMRAHGDKNLSNFEGIGRRVSFNMYSAIASIYDFGEHLRILDFGCGCGRVLKYFHLFFDKSSFYGTDVDGEAISWCQNQLGQIGEFVANEESPPLPLGDEFFDFVYSISVFTHLPEDMQFMWLEELRRVTKRDGYLLLSTHGDETIQTASKKGKRQFRERGFYYSVDAGMEGLPDYYQTSYHTPNYIDRHWSKYFEIVKIIQKGVANHQDLILCKRPG